MEPILLILVLAAGDPASTLAAQGVAEALRTQDAKAQVVLAPDATKRLAAHSITDGDLVTRSEKPLAITAANPRLVLVRIERHQKVQDEIIDVDVWVAGRRTGMSAVAGKNGDPLPGAIEGARRLVGDGVKDPSAAAERSDQALIAPFFERGDWLGLLKVVAAQSQPSPRLRYAVIMARLRLDDFDGATAELAQLRAAAPTHDLTKDAATAIDAAKAAGAALRDADPADDGGNVLR